MVLAIFDRHRLALGGIVSRTYDTADIRSRTGYLSIVLASADRAALDHTTYDSAVTAFGPVSYTHLDEAGARSAEQPDGQCRRIPRQFQTEPLYLRDRRVYAERRFADIASGRYGARFRL